MRNDGGGGEDGRMVGRVRMVMVVMVMMVMMRIVVW